MYTVTELDNERKQKRMSLLITAAIHAIILLLLIWLRLIPPIPPPEDEGILISFGTTEEGMGPLQASENTPEKQTAESNAVRDARPHESAVSKEKQPVKTQDVEPAPHIARERSKAEKTISRPAEKPQQPQEPTPDPAALYKGKKTQSDRSASAGEGPTRQPGDQGAPDGRWDATAGSGAGQEGVRFDLAGRGWRVKPQLEDKSQEAGRVVINIKVDREGNVISATGPGKGSTTQSLHLYNISREAAMKAKFSPCLRPECAEEQTGTITFIFTLE